VSLKVKVCGVTRPEDARLSSELGAWAVGMILGAESPRLLDLGAARKVRAAIPPSVMAVGVFADAPRPEIKKAISVLKLDAVQLHGEETPEACVGLSIPVFKALTLASTDDLRLLGRYKVAGFILELARRLPEGREEVGAEELTRRLELVREASRSSTVLVAGRLDPETVGVAVRLGKPDGVDVSSGVESSPGVKDEAKLRAFFAAAVAAPTA